MATLNQIVDETLLALAGYSADAEVLTVLTAAVDASTLTLPVQDAKQVARGLVEVGDELVYVSGIDAAANTLTVLVGQRGYRSTTAAAHPSGTLVRNHPRFPRMTVASTINDVIEQVWPDLFAVKVYEFPASGSRATYDLPVEALSILSVTWEVVGPSHSWQAVRRFDMAPAVGAVPPKLTLFDQPTPGRAVRVVYTASPTRITLDDELTVSGLSGSCRDLIVFGACSRLIGNVEPGRLVTQQVQAALQQGDPAGANTNAAKWFYTMYSRRLEDERAALHSQYPIKLRRLTR